MKLAIWCIALGALLSGPGRAQAASYNGIWNFSMRAVQSSCPSEVVKVGDSKGVSLNFEQSKKVLSAVPAVVGVDEPYRGYVTRNGIIMSLGSSCIPAPSGTCDTRSDSFTFTNSSKKSTKVVWINVTRDSANQFVCSTVYSGTARKKKAKKK